MGSKKLDIKTVNVSADDELYTFTCDEEYGGGYDQDLGCWFDLELFQLSDEEVSLLSEWLNAKSVTAVFVGRDGTTQSYALTKENRAAIQEMVTAYNLMLSSTVEQCEPILSSLAKKKQFSSQTRRVCGCSGFFFAKFQFFCKKCLPNQQSCAILIEL